MDSPYDYMIYKNSELNQYYIRVFLHDTTYLRLNETEEDTITCTIDYTKGNEILKKLWYNGVLKYDSPVAHVITIIK